MYKKTCLYSASDLFAQCLVIFRVSLWLWEAQSAALKCQQHLPHMWYGYLSEQMCDVKCARIIIRNLLGDAASKPRCFNHECFNRKKITENFKTKEQREIKATDPTSLGVLPLIRLKALIRAQSCILIIFSEFSINGNLLENEHRLFFRQSISKSAEDGLFFVTLQSNSAWSTAAGWTVCS